MSLRRLTAGVLVGMLLTLGIVGTAVAATSPNGPGQPGAPNTTCQQYTTTPGGSGSAAGAPFNANGTAGIHYAGNPGTPSLANGNPDHAISQYDIACFQQTTK